MLVSLHFLVARCARSSKMRAPRRVEFAWVVPGIEKTRSGDERPDFYAEKERRMDDEKWRRKKLASGAWSSAVIIAFSRSERSERRENARKRAFLVAKRREMRRWTWASTESEEIEGERRWGRMAGGIRRLSQNLNSQI